MNRSQFLLYLIAFSLLLYSTGIARFEEFCAQYDLLTTIAGKGEIGGKAVNGWKPEYEGGSALEAELSRPHFAMADRTGNIFIADKDAHAIRKISPDGIITTVAGTSVAGDNGDGPGTERQLSSPNGLWVTAEGTVYILDLGNSKIRKLDAEGNLVTLFTDPDGIAIGRGLWVSPDESEIYYAGGTVVKKWNAAEGISLYCYGFLQLGNIIMDPSGYLVVTDRGANQVYRLIGEQNYEIIAGSGGTDGGGSGKKATDTGLAGVRGIWFLNDGSYLLATHEGSQIWYVDTSGIIHLFLDGKAGDEYHSGDGEHFQTPGYKISEARSVSMDGAGNILIVENDVGYIRKISRKNSSSVKMQDKPVMTCAVKVYPNPFNSGTKIVYHLTGTGQVTLSIYNVLGSSVAVLVNTVQSPGTYQLHWNAVNSSNEPAATGVYFYRIQAGRLNEVGKLLYLK